MIPLSARLPSFSLRKWYFDLLTPERHHVFLYLAEVRLFGLGMCRLSLAVNQLGRPPSPALDLPLTLVSPLGDSAWQIITTTSGTLQLGREEIGADFLAPHFEIHAQGRVRDVNSNSGPTLAIPVGKHRSIQWTPHLIRAEVTGQVTTKDTTLTFESCPGYADHLSSNVFPLGVPIRTLCWGRLHHAELDLTYTLTFGEQPQERWCILVVKQPDRVRVFDRLTLQVLEQRPLPDLSELGPYRYQIEGQGPAGTIRLTVEHIDPGLPSDFIGAPEPFALGRKALRFLAQNPRGAKFFSWASVLLEEGEVRTEINHAMLIDEFVRFGNDAPTQSVLFPINQASASASV
jgi:hypothetical protein